MARTFVRMNVFGRWMTLKNLIVVDLDNTLSCLNHTIANSLTAVVLTSIRIGRGGVKGSIDTDVTQKS